MPRGMRCDPWQLVAEAMRVWREAHVAPDPVVRALRSTQVQIAAGIGDGHEHGLVCGHQVCRSGRQGSSSGRSVAQGLATHCRGYAQQPHVALMVSCSGPEQLLSHLLMPRSLHVMPHLTQARCSGWRSSRRRASGTPSASRWQLAGACGSCATHTAPRMAWTSQRYSCDGISQELNWVATSS